MLRYQSVDFIDEKRNYISLSIPNSNEANSECTHDTHLWVRKSIRVGVLHIRGDSLLRGDLSTADDLAHLRVESRFQLRRPMERVQASGQFGI